MSYIKKSLRAVGLVLFSLCLFGCNKNSANEIKVGTISGPETELMRVASEVAQKNYGLKVKIIEFTDYTMPNMALNDGSIDANMFQHQPYLTASIKNRHYDLVAIGKTFIYPMGIYSKKIKRLSDLSDGASVAIPNDPSNEARALLLLQQAGIITLKKDATVFSTPTDIQTNPKHIIFKELDAAQLARSLDDVNIAVINTNYAIPAGLMPTRDAIFLEDINSPYANIVVVRSKDKNNPKFIQLIDALHSEEVQEKAKQLFQDQAIPAW